MDYSYNFTKEVNKLVLFNAIAESLHLDDSQVICVYKGPKTASIKVAIGYNNLDNGDFKAVVGIYLYKNNLDKTQFYELDFGIKLAKKIKADLYASAPDSSPYDLIKITPNGSIYNCIDDYYEDEKGEEITKIVNLGKFSDEGIIKLKKEYTKAAIKEQEEYNNRNEDWAYKN